MKRLTPAKLTLMMFLVVGGLITAYVGKRLFARVEPPPRIETRNVPMAVADLAPGTVITEAHLGTGPVLANDMEPDVVLADRLLIGRVVRKEIKAATAIHSTHLYQPGEYPPLDIGEGMRAISVGVGTSTAIVNGLIKPGEYVDIHLTPSEIPDERYQGGFTMTLFKGVKVLAMNRSFQQGRPSSSGNIVTFELTPKQANIIILASDKGTLTLAHNPEGKGDGGVTVSSEDRATLDEILGLKPIPEPPQPPKPFVAEIYRGIGRQGLRFDEHGRVIPPGTTFDPQSPSNQPSQRNPPPDDRAGPPTASESFPSRG